MKYQTSGENDFEGCDVISAHSIEDAAMKDPVASEVAWSEGDCEVYVKEIETGRVFLCEVEVSHITNAYQIKEIE